MNARSRKNHTPTIYQIHTQNTALQKSRNYIFVNFDFLSDLTRDQKVVFNGRGLTIPGDENYICIFSRPLKISKMIVWMTLYWLGYVVA